MALTVQSVQSLWFFTSDLVCVLLFPQLLWALYDRRANLTGSVTAFAVSLALRLGGGEPLFGLAPVSYTHLRAHETVLAFVCRLLLENIKKQQQNTDQQ